MDSRRRTALNLSFSAWLLFLVICPFFLIFCTSFFVRGPFGDLHLGFSLYAYRDLADPLYLKIFFRTLVMAVLNTIFTLGFAYPLAFYLTRLEKKNASTMLVFIMIPFWTNYLIRLLAFMDVLRLSPWPLTFTYPGILLALVYNYLPFCILPLYSTLEKIPTSLLEAAADLGASKWAIFFRVLWPLSKKGVGTAALLVFIPSLGEFLIPEIVGGGKNYFLGTFLEQQFLVSRNWPLGAAAIVILVLLSLILLWLVRPDLEAAA